MNPLTDLPQILIGELGRTTGMFLACWEFKFSGSILKGKTAKIVIYDQALVTGVTLSTLGKAGFSN